MRLPLLPGIEEEKESCLQKTVGTPEPETGPLHLGNYFTLHLPFDGERAVAFHR